MRTAIAIWSIAVWSSCVGAGDGADPVDSEPVFAPAVVPLFGSGTPLEPPLVVDTGAAIVTRIADRVRDRHARESQFQSYEHYLPHYFSLRTIAIEIVDRVAKGGSDITVNITSLWPLDTPDFRAFYLGQNVLSEYRFNVDMAPAGQNRYTATVNFNHMENRPLQVGDRMEIELSPFLLAPPVGRANYYGTAFLYVVGQGGMVPWEGVGARLDSFPLPQHAWLGGRTTLGYNYSAEPQHGFKQLATNLAHGNAQPFVEGRRLHHTDFGDGAHSEAGNPVFTAHQGKLGPRYIARRCVACHINNGRALRPGTQPLQGIVRVGVVSGGAVTPHPQLGSVLQPQSTSGAAEGGVAFASWISTSGAFGDGAPFELQRPTYAFSGVVPASFSARAAAQLVGLGLLEAIAESTIIALEDPGDGNGDGISGRVQAVTDPQTGQLRLGRFGWKAGKARLSHQIASALNTDLGVTTSIFPAPDCGSAQSCGAAGVELSDAELDKLVRYVALLGVPARRNLGSAQAQQGETLFGAWGCAKCHTPSLPTSAFHPLAELRGQTIRPYTDLLLHDMGPGLADNLPEGLASGAEWRTPPLWAIGLTAGVTGGQAYLHDGRARTLAEAILWHGGEGNAAKEAFRTASSANRAALIAFLQSL